MERIDLLEKRVSQIELSLHHGMPADVSRMIDAVAAKYAISRQAIMSRRRDAGTALARQIAMYCCLRATSHSKTRICELFGRKHSVIQHTQARVREMMNVDKRIKQQVEELLK